MLRYIGRRLLQMIPVFFGATFLIFAMVYAMPGDPVQALGGDKGLPPSVAAQIRAEYNLDKPLWMQYLLYLKGILTFRLWKDILRTGSNRRDGWRFPGNDSVSFHGYLL
mgnify:CR=1 FL=1